MHSAYRTHEEHHRCHEGSRGPAIYYGYCHETGRMRMMDYEEYMRNFQTGYSKMRSAISECMRPWMQMHSGGMWFPHLQGHGGEGWWGKHHHECGCGCHGEHEHWEEHEHHEEHRHHDCHHEHHDCCHEHDCHCSCCIKCADAVEFVRCGEIRLIPITFDNDTRRERDVTVALGEFATGSGTKTGWNAALSETQFKLPPCGEKTILLRVPVDCRVFDGGVTGTNIPGTNVPNPNAPETGTPAAERTASVDSCKVAYATIRAEGCLIRPMVVAVAVLPNDCKSHRAGCGCGCCC